MFPSRRGRAASRANSASTCRTSVAAAKGDESASRMFELSQTQPDTEQQIPVTALRRTIAERMTQSRQQTAPVTLTRRVDASRLSCPAQSMEAAASAGTGPVA